MKINELQLTKDLKNNVSPKEVLKKYGWNVLGTGMTGTVAQHPQKNYVLKIFADDSGYEEFVNFIMSYKNPHFPVIGKSIKIIPGTDYKYVTMEKLSSVSYMTLFGKYLSELIYLYVRSYQTDTNLNDSLDKKISVKMHTLGFGNVHPRQSDLNVIFKLLGKQPDPSWMDAVDHLLKYGDEVNEPYLDLHGDNFMLRGPTLIINDPW